MTMTHYDEKEARYLQNVANMDEATSVFLARQLTHIRTQTLTVKKAPMNAFQVFPVQTDIPAGAESAVQYIYDAVGMAEIISNYADALPRVDVVAKEQAVKVFSIGDAYGYNYREVKNAQFANIPLSALRAQQARRGIDLKLNKIAWNGDKAHHITGFLDNENISTISLPALPGSRKRRGQEAASARVTVRLAASGCPGAATMQSVSAEKTSEMISG